MFFHGGTDHRYWCYEDSVGAVAPGGRILRGWPASVQLIYAAAGDKKFRWRSRPSCVDHVPPEGGRWHGSCSLPPPCVPCPSVPAT
ncbi:putative transcriptional regulator domain protein [Pseudomonas aeruginosa]|nr:putative transcriptional regulator domain protein [Pseudomonas aeruginosa]PRW09112.1 putative transcriptional regulator domain protein [Pseudomonas aeruginosa]